MAKDSEYIIVNGEKMTIKDYKKMVTEKQKTRRGKKRFLKIETPKKQKSDVKEISALALQIEEMIKPITVLKSIQVYRTHAYRSWGNIANEILSYNGIRKPMTTYCTKFGELNSLMEEIQKMAKGNEKAAYQYIEKLSWKLDDMKSDIIEIMGAVNESDVCRRFKHHEAINGKGRQLGLETVVKKAYKAIDKIEMCIKDLNKMVEEGTNPFKYGEHMSLSERHRCWA